MDLIESIALHEASNYKIKDNEIHISKKAYSKIHKDYKNTDKNKPSMIALNPKTGATEIFPVVFVNESINEADDDRMRKEMLRDLTNLHKELMDNIKGGNEQSLAPTVALVLRAAKAPWYKHFYK